MKKLILFLSLLFPFNSYGVVALISSGTPNVSSAAATSLDLTTVTIASGNSSCLAVAVIFSGNPGTVTAPSWDSGGTPQVMTLGPLVTNSTRSRLYYLASPTTGNKTLSTSWGSSVGVTIGAVAFSGITFCVTTADNTTNSGTSATPSITVTSDPNGVSIGVMGTTSLTPSTTGGTEVFITIVGGFGAGMSYTIGGTSNSHTWASGANSFSAVGMHLGGLKGGLTTMGIGGKK